MGYTSSSEREAAYFVPLGLIIKDKIAGWGENISFRLFLPFRKWHKFLRDPDNLPTTELSEWDEKMDCKRSRFAIWFEEAQKEKQ